MMPLPTQRDNRYRPRVRPDRQGMALLVVVVLIMLISLGAYRYSFYMESQYRLTRLHEEQLQSRLAAISGIELATAIVELPPSQRSALGGLVDNAKLFRNVDIDAKQSPTGEVNRDAWRFCLVAPRMQEDANTTAGSQSGLVGAVSIPIRFGLENESAKLHIPTLLAWDRAKPGQARMALMSLPGMEESSVDAWLRELGAMAPVDRGTATPGAEQDRLRSLWFGGDLNQNYQLDPLEARLNSQNASEESSSPLASIKPSSTSETFRPLQRYLTWTSGHRNSNRNGQPRIFLNDTDLRGLHQKLTAVWSPEWANFVIAMRQIGPSGFVAGPINSATNLVQDLPPDFSKAPVFTFRSPLDLVGAVVELPAVTGSTAAPATSSATSVKRTLRNPFSSDLGEVRNYLGRVLDDVTVENVPFSEGRVDATEAPIEVLACVPGINTQLATRIHQQRTTSSNASTTPTERDTIAWLLDVVDLAKLKELEPYLTSRSDVYSVQSIGYRDNRSAVYRTTVTIDARQSPVQWRNQKIWHPWDRGFPIDQLSDSKP